MKFPLKKLLMKIEEEVKIVEETRNGKKFMKLKVDDIHELAPKKLFKRIFNKKVQTTKKRVKFKDVTSLKDLPQQSFSSLFPQNALN